MVKPDPLQRAYYDLAFKTAFIGKRGTEFQAWFVKAAGYAYGPDFEEVKPYGARGDLKCDGLRRSTGSMFQCYAPSRFEDAKTIRKISDDFVGAVAHWPRFLKTWHFVHNDRDGLSPDVTKCLEELGLAHKHVKLEPWSEPELWNMINGLEVHQLEELFGLAPNMPSLDNLGFADLKPIVDAIAGKEPDLNASLTPPSAHKLERNRLSSGSAEMLRLGRRKEAKVEDYFNKVVRPDVNDKIAESIREQYRSLKALELEPDAIFGHLQTFMGMHGRPPRQAAALAVLCYFFDRCDIFEDIKDLEADQ